MEQQTGSKLGNKSRCIFSPFLCNIYAEYIMRIAGLDEAQAGIKIARRNINNLRWADVTTLMAESEEALKSLLMKVKQVKWSGSVVSNSATTWSVAYQVPPPMGFSRQEYWSGLPFPSPGDLPSPGIKPRSPALQADSLLTEPPGKLLGYSW